MAEAPDTFWQGPSMVRAHLRVPYNRRKPAFYSMDFINDYIPTKRSTCRKPIGCTSMKPVVRYVRDQIRGLTAPRQPDSLPF